MSLNDEHLCHWASDSPSAADESPTFALFFFFPAALHLQKQQVTGIVSIFHSSLRTIFKDEGGISTGFTLSCRDTSNTLISCFGPRLLSTSNSYSTSFFSKTFHFESTGHSRDTGGRHGEVKYGKVRIVAAVRLKHWIANKKTHFCLLYNVFLPACITFFFQISKNNKINPKISNNWQTKWL